MRIPLWWLCMPHRLARTLGFAWLWVALSVSAEAEQFRCTGTLVDEAGLPIAGALVGTDSVRHLRMLEGSISDLPIGIAPGDVDAAVLPGNEDLTDSTGHFEFECTRGDLGQFYAWFPNGQRERIPDLWSRAPDKGPIDLGTVSVERKAIFAFEFYEGESRVLPLQEETETDNILHGFSGPWTPFSRKVRFSFELEEEPAWQERATLLVDGSLRLALPRDRARRLSEVTRARIKLPRRAAVFDSSPSSWSEVAARRIDLASPHILSLRIQVTDSRRAGCYYPCEFPLYADVSTAVLRGGLSLTGLGGQIVLPAQAGIYDVDLPVLHPGELWLSTFAYGPGAQPRLPQPSGPFHANGERPVVLIELSKTDGFEYSDCGLRTVSSRRLTLCKADGSQVARGKVIAGPDLKGEVNEGRGQLEGEGRPGERIIFRTEDAFHEGQVLVRQRLIESPQGWKLTLDRWRDVEVHLTGLSTLEQSFVSSPILVQVVGERRFGWVHGTRIRDRGDGIVRFRYRVNTGAWRAVAKCFLHGDLDQAVAVQYVDELQVFEVPLRAMGESGQ